MRPPQANTKPSRLKTELPTANSAPPARGSAFRRLLFHLRFRVSTGGKVWALLHIPVLALLPLALVTGCKPSPPDPNRPLTFADDVAPIVFENCSYCHRPNQSAPFDLLTHEDVAKRGAQIVEVTQSRYMPPWLPAPGMPEFAHERRLSESHIDTLRRWVEQGAPAGDLERQPALPVWSEGWQLGEPDLVVTMAEPYSLYAEGEDVYRNFVLPLSNQVTRYVRAVEFDPGNRRIVHHAFFQFDTARNARHEDSRDPEVGFDGIHTPSGVQSPPGHFLSWQPGKQPAASPDDMPFVLEPDTDMVLQLHLQPTGKPETIRSRVAFHFTDRPPSRQPMKIWFGSYNIMIPAGATNHVVEDAYTLPCDVDVLGILPHAHYLAREMQAHAASPGGDKQWLMWIKDWDFNWQGDYVYRKPIRLRKGTTISMRFFYDNSTNNPVNPNHPPRPTTYGLQSTDEMAELWLQVLPRDDAGREAIRRDYEKRGLQDAVAFNSFLLRSNPNDALAHANLGKAMMYQGRSVEARSALRQAIGLDGELVDAHYFLGLLHRMEGRLNEAVAEFEAVIRLDPRHTRAIGNLGFLHMQMGTFDEAEAYLRETLRLNPDDALATKALNELVKARK